MCTHEKIIAFVDYPKRIYLFIFHFIVSYHFLASENFPFKFSLSLFLFWHAFKQQQFFPFFHTRTAELKRNRTYHEWVRNWNENFVYISCDDSCEKGKRKKYRLDSLLWLLRIWESEILRAFWGKKFMLELSFMIFVYRDSKKNFERILSVLVRFEKIQLKSFREAFMKEFTSDI